MEKLIIALIGCLPLCSSVASQERPRELRGVGHVLGETAEQFFSVGSVGELVHACDKKDWKTVKNLAKTVEQQSKIKAKEFCDNVAVIKQGATAGARQEYGSSGDIETMRTDTFTLDGGHLVKIRMIYAMPIAEIEGFRPKSFDELFSGLREAYGDPSKSYSEPVVSTYGVKRGARRAIWEGKQNVISVTEHLGEHGQIEIVAETLAEYERDTQAPKTANPLQ
jgi:hypothetical protein